MSLDGSLPVNPCDVLLGRGAATDNYKGNIQFRKLIHERRDAYRATDERQRKNELALEVVAAIHSTGGRFLCKVDSTVTGQALKDPRQASGWVVADDRTVMEKVKQALREKGNRAAQPDPNAAVPITLDTFLSQQAQVSASPSTNLEDELQSSTRSNGSSIDRFAQGYSSSDQDSLLRNQQSTLPDLQQQDTPSSLRAVDELRLLPVEWNPTSQFAGPMDYNNINVRHILQQYQLQQHQMRAPNTQDIVDPQQHLIQQLLSNVSPPGHRQPQHGYCFSAQPAASTDFLSRLSQQQEDYLRSRLQAVLQTRQRLESTADVSALGHEFLRQPTREPPQLQRQIQAEIFPVGGTIPHPAEQHQEALRNFLSGNSWSQCDNPLLAVMGISSQLGVPPTGHSQQFDLHQGEQALIADRLLHAAFADAIGNRNQTGINRLVPSPPSSQTAGASISDYIRESQLRSMLATEAFRQYSLLTPASAGPIATSVLPASSCVGQNAPQYSLSGQASLALDNHVEDDRKPSARTSQDDTKSSSTSSSSSFSEAATRKRRRAN
jgi:hypothetical protein